MQTKRIAALAALLVTGLTACEDVAAPSADETSEMRVSVSGDGSASTRSADGPSSSGGTSGRITVDARVYVAAAGGEWLEVTRGAARQTVQASGSDGARVLATAEVHARRYDRVRVEFERVEADAVAAVELGVGGATASVQVTGEGGRRVVVEREVAFEARSGAVAEIEIDLNADQWLSRADATTRSVAEAEFRSAVLIRSR